MSDHNTPPLATIDRQPPQGGSGTAPPAKRQRLAKATADLIRKGFKTLGKDTQPITVRTWLLEQGCKDFASDKQINALRRGPRRQRQQPAAQPSNPATLPQLLANHWGEFQDIEADIRDLAGRCGGKAALAQLLQQMVTLP